MSGSFYELSDDEFARLLKKAPSGGSRKKRTYLPPDPDDPVAHAVWAETRAPSSRKRCVELLTDWFGSDCELCGTAVDLTLATPHPARFNIDHRVPRSHGGAWVFGNLRVVHRACNSQRSNLALPEPDQLTYRELLEESISEHLAPGDFVPSPLYKLRDRAALAEAVRSVQQLWVDRSLEVARPADLVEKLHVHIARYDERAAVAISEVQVEQQRRLASR